MPSRAPSYYHWSMDKPATTNQTYGYLIKDTIDPTIAASKPRGPFDYTRPFSNSGFFPQISWDDRLTYAVRPRPCNRGQVKSGGPLPRGPANRFDINKGYTMGHVPITENIVKQDQPAGIKLNRSVSAPAAYRAPQPKGKDIYLWHTLSGCLVHAKNYPSEEVAA